MSQQNQQQQPVAGIDDDNSSNEEGDFVMLGQQFTALDVSEQQQQIEGREVDVNWPNPNGPNENGNELNELKLKMAALEAKNQVLEIKLAEQEMKAKLRDESLERVKMVNIEVKDVIRANEDKMTKFAKEMAILMDQQQEKVNSSQLAKSGEKSENVKQNSWDANGGIWVKISPDGLIADIKRIKENVLAKKGFSISSELCRQDQSVDRIIHYYEVTQVSSYGFAFWVGLSADGFITAADYVKGVHNSPHCYAVPRGSDFCILSQNPYYFELPEGVVDKPKWNGPGDVVGCGILANSGNCLAIFFTLNGIPLGKPIPIAVDVDVLIPTVTIWDVSLEANFGDNLVNKPFKYDVGKCPGLVFE